MTTTSPSATSSQGRRAPSLVLGAMLAGLACAGLALVAGWLEQQVLGAPGSLPESGKLVQAVLIVSLPGGSAGLIAMRANGHFDTRRGRFWTVVGGVGFFSASLMFTAAARVQTVTELVSLFGGWIGATALLGLPLGWWASRQ